MSAFAVGTLLALLLGCGQKGPLTLPGAKGSSAATPATAASAASAPR
jgi:predicted small lipoprotein YifL